MIPIYQTDPSNTQYKYIGFHARARSKSERKYSTTKRELLAIVFALKKYHQFLWGNHSTLYTDHKSLTYLHTKPVTNPMMGGWLDTICDYNLTIVHRPGILNVLPDTLSRLFTPDKRLAEGNSPKASHSGDHTTWIRTTKPTWESSFEQSFRCWRYCQRTPQWRTTLGKPQSGSFRPCLQMRQLSTI